MHTRQSCGSHLIGIVAALALAGCDRKADPAKPQAAMSTVGSGGRVAANSVPSAVASGEVDFGDDASKFSRDGECDDKRFTGDGMTATPLLESDIRHDATDCRAAYKQGRLTLGPAAPPASSGQYAASGVDHIMWGDDASKYSRDGECDDKRFTGPGLTSTPLLDSDVQHDATDCRTAFAQGRLSLAQ